MVGEIKRGKRWSRKGGPGYFMPDGRLPHGRPVRVVELRPCDWDGPRRVEIRETQFDPPKGAPALVVILRSLSLHPEAWWTTTQIRACSKRVMTAREFNVAWIQGRKRDMIERAANPHHDPTRGFRGNVKWYYRITRIGLVYVEMMD